MALQDKVKAADMIFGEPDENEMEKYEEFPVRGSAPTVDEAESRLVINAKRSGARYIANPSEPNARTGPHGTNYIISASAYSRVMKTSA